MTSAVTSASDFIKMKPNLRRRAMVHPFLRSWDAASQPMVSGADTQQTQKSHPRSGSVSSQVFSDIWNWLCKLPCFQPDSWDIDGLQTQAEQQLKKSGGKPQPMSLNLLFGPTLSGVTFKQSAQSNTCYLLAMLDAILHHPRGKEVLARIPVKQTLDHYRVSFPGQAEPIEFLKTELGKLPNGAGTGLKGVRSLWPGPRVLERAYAQIAQNTMGDYDEPATAAEKIFGPDVEVISLQNDPRGSQLWGQKVIEYNERQAKLLDYIQTQGKKPSKKSPADCDEWIEILTAMPKRGAKHYKSFRLDQSLEQSGRQQNVVLADPFNTLEQTQRLSIKDFLSLYHVEGIRLPLHKISEPPAQNDLALA